MITVGKRIRKLRLNKQITQEELGKVIGVSTSMIGMYETNARKPSYEVLIKIADYFKVPTDYLLGRASSIIEDRLKELGMTMVEVANKANVSLHWLQNLDTFIPGELGDYEIGYDWITKIADVLKLPSSTLRAALARQEIPAYDGPVESPEEAFGTPYIEKPNLETHPVGNFVKVPIIGTVTAGPNGLAYEDYQGEEIVDTGLVNGGNLFYLRIKGDSMIGDGILPGDLALVRETPEVEYGALAIVIVNEEEGTIKRVYQNGDSITLLASNPKYPPQVFKREEMRNVRIVGEVKMTMRNY